MAVARMLKVTVIGHNSVVDDVVAAVQQAGVLEIAQQPFDLPPVEASEDEARRRELDEYIADAQFVRDFLGRHRSADVPFSAFISEKIHLSQDEYLALEPDLAFMRLYRTCVTIADGLAHGERERMRLRTLAADLKPWRDLRLQVGRWRGTEHVALFTGTVPASKGAQIRQLLREQVREITVEELGPVGARQAWVVMAHQSVVDDARAALALTDFGEVSFPELSDYPAEEIARALEKMGELEAEAADLTEQAQSLASEGYERAFALVEALRSEREALTVRGEFGATDCAFLISGWIAADGQHQLQRVLEPWGRELDFTFTEPAEDDSPPVALRNPRLLRPFEVLTDLYGRPKYREVDPTPLLAPFFLLFFAICISDFGYGAMLITGSYLIKSKLDVAPGVKKFLDLLMMGGAGAMVVGVLFGSYFAIPFESLPPFMQSLRVLDPLGQIIPFLLMAVAIGVVQVFLGVFIAAISAFRRGDPAAAIFEQLSTIFMFAMIAVGAFVPGAMRWALVLGIGLTMLMQGHAITAAFGHAGSPAWDRGLGIGWLVVTLGALAAFAFTGDVGVIWALAVVTVVGLVASRTVRRSVVSLLGGAYAVYGMSSFIGDILSYTRLASLALSGAMVGWVFNLLAGMVWGGASGLFAQGGIGYLWGALVVLAAVAVFVFGHVFNVVINLLGAFVHPARLQFVEFFSKFHKAGGRSFAPFGYSTKNLVLDAGSTRQEGGTAS